MANTMSMPALAKKMNRYILKRIQYILMNHPIPFNRHEALILSGGGPKIFANSFPKAGTNLLKRIVNLLPNSITRYNYHLDHNIDGWEKQLPSVWAGQSITAHLKYDPALVKQLGCLGFKSLFIIRDPRDVIVSNAYYIAKKDKSHRLHSYYNSLMGKDDWIMAGIQGIPGELLSDGIPAKSLGELLSGFLPWLDEQSCLCVRYEDLVGSKGGGDDDLQYNSTRKIIQHVGLRLDDGQSRMIAHRVYFPNARTFRKGAIGDWRNHFTAEHVIEMKKTCGDALIRLGYENDDNWSY